MIWSQDLQELPWVRESPDDSVARWIQVHDRMVEAGLERDDAVFAADLEVGQNALGR